MGVVSPVGDERHEQWRYWLALRRVRGVGNVTYRELLERFATPQAVLAASVAALTAAGVHPEVARAIAGFTHWAGVEAELRRLRRLGARLVTRADDDYPVNLTHLHDPPPFLYVHGTFVPRDRLAIAIVGSRSASAYGRGVARDLARGLAERGVTIVIGREHPDDSMRPFSLVATRYGSGRQRGTLGVVGPTRLHYSRAVAMVRYLSSVMDELLEIYFG